MKVRIEGYNVVFDLSDEDEEVVDYVLDQIDDRIDEEVSDIEIDELEIDRTKKIVKIPNILQIAVERIIEEKQADMQYERKHEEDMDIESGANI